MPFPTMMELRNDFRAMLRGEKRVVGYGGRGRIYTPRNPDAPLPSDGSTMRAKSKGVGNVKVNRIWSEDRKRWYTPDEWAERFPVKE